MKSLRVFLVAVIATIIALNLFSATDVRAFSADNHDRATEEALKGRVSPDAMEAIKQANRAVDKDPNYDPAEHFDRDPTKTSEQCFRESVKAVQAKKAEAIAAIIRCDTEAAIKAIGQALHKIQDFFAHSNYVDLNDAQRQTLREAFNNPNIGNETEVPLPTWLRLTAYYNEWGKYNPNSYNPSGWWVAPIPGFIPEVDPFDGKPYDHGLCSGKHKDKKPGESWYCPNSNSGDGARPITRNVNGVPVTQTAFDWAMEAAQQQSTELINQIIAAVGPDLWNKKFGNGNYTFPLPPAPKPPSVPLPPGPMWHLYPYSVPYPYPRLDMQVGVFGLVPYEGGILDDGEGTAVFVPSGAVLTPEWFYAFDVSPDFSLGAYLPESARLLKVREFWPDGMQFQEPVTISMVYSLSEIEGVSESSLRAYEFDLYHDCTWELIPNSTVDTVNRTVTFQASHFTIYGIGGSPLGGGGAGGVGIPVFPSIYIGIAAALGAGVLAYFVRRRLVIQG